MISGDAGRPLMARTGRPRSTTADTTAAVESLSVEERPPWSGEVHAGFRLSFGVLSVRRVRTAPKENARRHELGDDLVCEGAAKKSGLRLSFRAARRALPAKSGNHDYSAVVGTEDGAGEVDAGGAHKLLAITLVEHRDVCWN
jgi:hypothetical protein